MGRHWLSLSVQLDLTPGLRKTSGIGSGASSPTNDFVGGPTKLGRDLFTSSLLIKTQVGGFRGPWNRPWIKADGRTALMSDVLVSEYGRANSTTITYGYSRSLRLRSIRVAADVVGQPTLAVLARLDGIEIPPGGYTTGSGQGLGLHFS